MADSQILIKKEYNIIEVQHEIILVLDLVRNDGLSIKKDDLCGLIKNCQDAFQTNVSCIGFRCDCNCLDKALYLCKFLKLNTNYNTLWYNTSDTILIDKMFKTLQWLDYIFLQCNKDARFQIMSNENGFVLKEMNNQ